MRRGRRISPPGIHSTARSSLIAGTPFAPGTLGLRRFIRVTLASKKIPDFIEAWRVIEQMRIPFVVSGNLARAQARQGRFKLIGDARLAERRLLGNGQMEPPEGIVRNFKDGADYTTLRGARYCLDPISGSRKSYNAFVAGSSGRPRSLLSLLWVVSRPPKIFTGMADACNTVRRRRA